MASQAGICVKILKEKKSAEVSVRSYLKAVMIKRMKESVLILINTKGIESKIYINILSNLEHSLFFGSLSQKSIWISQS